MLLSQVLKTRRNEAFICVKFGAVRTPDGIFTGLDLRPAAVKNFLAYSLKRLGTDYIDLYQPCRVDPHVPIEDTIGAMAEMKERGRNQELTDALRAIAARKNCTLPQLALAWVLSRGPDIIPLVGARTTKRLNEALGGAVVTLSSDDLAEIDRVAPRGAIAGERYPKEQMAWLDSERPSR